MPSPPPLTSAAADQLARVGIRVALCVDDTQLGVRHESTEVDCIDWAGESLSFEENEMGYI